MGDGDARASRTVASTQSRQAKGALVIRERIPRLSNTFEPTPHEPFPHNVGPFGTPMTDPLFETLVVIVAVAMCGAFGFRMWRAYRPRSWKYRLKKRLRGAARRPEA